MLKEQNMATSTGTQKPEDETLIFVYGTLKRGFPNHYRIEDLIRSNDAVPFPNSNTFQTQLKFPLVIGPFGIPYLLNFPGSGHRVRGELYSVSAHGLVRLDEIEGLRYGHYERLPVHVESSSSSSEVAAEAYFAHPSYAAEMWRKCGEVGLEEYSEMDAARYVKPDVRPDGLTFIDAIRTFLA